MKGGPWDFQTSRKKKEKKKILAIIEALKRGYHERVAQRKIRRR